MDTSLISRQTVELVSQMTGQRLRREDISPPLLFLAGLITVLLGVIYADGTVGAEEIQHLRTTLTELIPANNSLRQLAMLMAKGVREYKIYKKLPELLALTACFSEEEKLLLISFGYQMSAADGSMDDREKQYLTIIANKLGVDARYLTVLEASFSSRAIADTAALTELHRLLDPAQFQSLDSMFVRAASHIIEHLPAKSKHKTTQNKSVFVRAASHIIEHLPVKPKHKTTQNKSVSSYQELKKFEEYRQQLNAVCGKLGLTLLDGSDRNVLSPTLAEEITKVSQRLQSPCFRVAVVGEFSKGKSTLLNALLGEKIQPTRALPCSGTVTTLKYGSQRRVICRYKDKKRPDEEILPEEYEEKARISKKAASASSTDKTPNSEIAEIVFEHPELELCRNGVEIIDTPGLNEAAERTLETEQVLKKADAVIFLTHAQNVLTKTETKFLSSLKKELNSGKEDEGAKNIFIIVNCFDSLRTEEDRKDVEERVETIVNNVKNPIIAGENRIHFISALFALEAILAGNENDDYLKAFQGFTDSLEKFLTVERGAIALQQSAAGIQQIIDTGCEELNQWQKMSEGKLTVSEGDKPKIFEQMAEVSGREVKIRLLANELRDKSLEESLESWNEWVEELGERLLSKSHRWTSEHGHIMSQDKLTKDYADQFVRDITKEIDDWGNQKVQSILKQNMGVLDSKIGEDIDAIRQEFRQFDQQLSTSLVAQFNNLATARSLGGFGASGSGIASSINANIGSDESLGVGLGLGALVGAGLLFFTGLGFIGVILGGLAAGAGGGFGFSFLDGDAVKDQIKQKVCELGVEKFGESAESIFEKVQERIIAVFDDRTNANSDAMSKAIALWENLLEQQEMRDRQNQAECEAEKVWLAEKRRELEQVKSQIETILDRSAG